MKRRRQHPDREVIRIFAASNLRMLSVLRLLRLVRLVRVFSMFDELSLIISGLVKFPRRGVARSDR